MAENICTIPINDVFGPKDGCPMCRLHEMLEKNCVEYITGAAMMEPSVRVETNEIGFCFNHFKMMVNIGKRLPNALILETHLDKIAKELIPASVKNKPDKKQIQKIKELQSTCFVCNKIDWGMTHMMSTIFASYQNDPEFKKLYTQQQYICMPHYTMLMSAAINKGINPKLLAEFYNDTANLSGNYLEQLKSDISYFCSMYDYRNSGGDWKNSKDSIERSIEFLTSEKMPRKE